MITHLWFLMWCNIDITDDILTNLLFILSMIFFAQNRLLIAFHISGSVFNVILLLRNPFLLNTSMETLVWLHHFTKRGGLRWHFLLKCLFLRGIEIRVSAMLRHVQDNCPKTSISYQSCFNNVTKLKNLGHF
jgi:hypothetical protein